VNLAGLDNHMYGDPQLVSVSSVEDFFVSIARGGTLVLNSRATDFLDDGNEHARLTFEY
jgi:hypothetical protein